MSDAVTSSRAAVRILCVCINWLRQFRDRVESRHAAISRAQVRKPETKVALPGRAQISSMRVTNPAVWGVPSCVSALFVN